jgi:hypothetical protein
LVKNISSFSHTQGKREKGILAAQVVNCCSICNANQTKLVGDQNNMFESRKKRGSFPRDGKGNAERVMEKEIYVFFLFCFDFFVFSFCNVIVVAGNRTNHSNCRVKKIKYNYNVKETSAVSHSTKKTIQNKG